MITVLYILCGLIAGTLGGMLGIGGGVVIVPFLYFIFHYSGIFGIHTMQMAASTSLAISLMISLTASLIQFSKKTILFVAIKFLAPGLIIGCCIGALLANVISSEMIREIFGIGAILIGVYFTIPRLPHLHIASAPNPTLSIFGIMIGTLSSLLGIGGGIFTFPTFLAYGMSAKASSATSSCATTLSTLMGTLAYMFVAWNNSAGQGKFGFIEIHALLTIGIAALITAPMGVKLSHAVDVHTIKRIFGVCLSLVGITMLLI